MHSSGTNVFETSFPIIFFIVSKIIGVRTVSPTISKLYISFNFNLVSFSNRSMATLHKFSNFFTTGSIIFSNSSLVKLYTKSSPSNKLSHDIVISLLTVSDLRTFVIVSNNLIFDFGASIGLPPYFFSKSSDNF